MKRISKNVFTDTTLPGCNPSYVITSKGAVVVDTPQLPTKAVSMREEILKKASIQYIINTEHHPDHVFGNYYFRGHGIVIGHQNVYEKFMFAPGIDPYEKVKNDTISFDNEGSTIFPEEKEYWLNCNKPSVLFKDYLNILLGDHEFELFYTGGHSISQICVYCPTERVLFTGDNIFNQVQIWFAEADPYDILKALDFINEFDVDYIVPGHGNVCTKAAINENKTFIFEWLSSVQGGITKGWSKEKCQEEISFKNKYPIDIGLDNVSDDLQKWNVSKLYDYLQNMGKKNGYNIYP